MNKFQKKQPSIVWWIDHLGPGGTQQFLSKIASTLSNYSFSQSVVVINNVVDSVLLESMVSKGIEVKIIGKWRLLLGIGLIQTIWWLKKKNFDVSVTMLFYSDICGPILSAASGIKKIVSTQRSSNMHYRKWQMWILSKSLEYVDSVILNNESSKQVTGRYLPFDKRVIVIPNGIDHKKYQIKEVTSNIREELGFDKNAILLGCVGRLSKEKGADLLIDAVNKLCRKQIKLLLIGQGPYKVKLEEQIAALDLEGQVFMMGHRFDVPNILRQLDLYVQPSRFEGMPMAVLEAMASSCPIVATAVDGIKELVIDGKTGWLVERENPDSLAKAIIECLDNSVEAKKRVLKASERVSKWYNEQDVHEAWVSEITNQ